MKYNWIIIPAILLFIIAIALVYNISNFLWKEPVLSYHSKDLRNYRYHFVMITKDTEESYWNKALESALRVAKERKAALEYYGPRFSDLKELERFLEMTVLSNVDGILVSVPNEINLKTLINEAAAKKIPVVALANDIDDTKRTSFVGVNAYDLGFKTGQALTQAVTGAIKVAVLVNSNFSAYSYQRYLQGIKDVIEGYPGLQLTLILTSKGSSISAEEQTQSILKNYPEIQAIICSNASDTLGVAKVVVDLNRVTHVTIIGSGLTPEIANYINRGVIWGVLADDPDELGAQGMNTMIKIKEGIIIQQHYDMPIYLINKNNLNVYSPKLIPPEKNADHESK
ncbi:MAG: substrate-binding domain-containing protein [Bacillota bacterium]